MDRIEAQCRGEAHLKTIELPSLVIQSTGDMGVFPSDAKLIFEALGSKDKTLKMPKGAHYFEDAPHYRGEVADMIAAWLETRV